MNMAIPVNLKICLETIKEVSNLSIVPKSLTDWLLVQVGIVKNTVISGEDDPDKNSKQII